MRNKRLKDVCIFFGYALLFAALREFSLPHWSISSGLRLGALLLFPIDYWPAIIAGDCAGSILYKANALHMGNVYWFITSTIVPSFVSPVVALMLRAVRWNNPSTSAARSISLIIKGCLLQAAMLSAISVFGLSLINFGQGTDHQSGGPAYFFFILFVGHYLGAMMIIPAIVTHQWRKIGRLTGLVDYFPRRGERAKIDAILGSFAIAALTIINIQSHDRIVQLATGLLMLIPASLVAVRNGWTTAVLLTTAANLGLRLTLRHWYDTELIEEQILMGIAITGTLGLAAHVTQLFAQVRTYDRERASSIWLARQNLSFGDGMIRRGAIELEQQYKKMAEWAIADARAPYALTAASSADVRWSLGIAPTFRLPPAIESMQLECLELSGVRVALAFGHLAEQLRNAGIYYSSRITPRANNLPNDMERILYRLCYEVALDLCYRFKPTHVHVKLRILNHASRTIALQVKVRPGRRDISMLPGPCLTTENVRWLAKTFSGEVKDKTFLEAPSITIFLRDR